MRQCRSYASVERLSVGLLSVGLMSVGLMSVGLLSVGLLKQHLASPSSSVIYSNTTEPRLGLSTVAITNSCGSGIQSLP